MNLAIFQTMIPCHNLQLRILSPEFSRRGLFRSLAGQPSVTLPQLHLLNPNSHKRNCATLAAAYVLYILVSSCA